MEGGGSGELLFSAHWDARRRSGEVWGRLVGTLLIGVSLVLRAPGMFESLWFDEVYRTFQVMQSRRTSWTSCCMTYITRCTTR